MKKLASFLCKIAYFIGILFTGYLAYNTTHYTFTHDFNDYSAAYLYEGPDSRLLNLVALVVLLLILFLGSKLLFFKAKSEERKNKRVFIFSIVVSLILLVLLVLWANQSRINPYWDQAFVFQAAQSAMQGDYSFLTDSVYLTMYPQQLGLIFFESLFLHIWNDYMIFQYMNAVFIALIVILAGGLAWEIFGRATASFAAVMLTAFCAPLFYYVSFIYGDVFSIFASLLVGWCLIRWLQNGKTVYPVISLVIACIMLPVRENTLIFLITAAIVLVIAAMKNKKWQPLLLAVLILVLPYLANGSIRLFYESKAGVQFDNGIPSINWVVMGLRGDLEEGQGVGYYDGYNYYVWQEMGSSKEASAEYSKEMLQQYLITYKTDPSYCYRFFRYKLFEQWLEPTFDCINMTVSGLPTSWEAVDLLYNQDTVIRMNSYMNYFLTLAYFLAFVCFLAAFLKDKDHYVLLPAVFFIGIFLFSLIWEAKGRYTFPGFMLMLILSAGGFTALLEGGKAGILKIRERKKK